MYVSTLMIDLDSEIRELDIYKYWKFPISVPNNAGYDIRFVEFESILQSKGPVI